MADFDAALSLVLKHEGGYVNNANDPGGPTNMGITLGVLQAWHSANAAPIKVVVTAENVKALTRPEAARIYRANYWQAIKGDAISSQAVAERCFDMCVLRGVGAGIRAIQQALGITVDGAFGPKTLAALNDNAPSVFLNVFRSLCVKAFAALVKAKPPLAEFISNWVRRAEEMAEVINLLQQRSGPPVPAAGALPGLGSK